VKLCFQNFNFNSPTVKQANTLFLLVIFIYFFLVLHLHFKVIFWQLQTSTSCSLVFWMLSSNLLKMNLNIWITLVATTCKHQGGDSIYIIFKKSFSPLTKIGFVNQGTMLAQAILCTWLLYSFKYEIFIINNQINL